MSYATYAQRETTTHNVDVSVEDDGTILVRVAESPSLATMTADAMKDAVREMAKNLTLCSAGVAQNIPPYRNAAPKPKRNAPCPCGSGRKYMRCCGRKGE